MTEEEPYLQEPVDLEEQLLDALVNAKLCPYCLNPIAPFPAVSRVDNTTEICSNCGFREALAGLTRPPHPPC